MEPLARLPLFFDLDSCRVVVAGDTDAAAWKAELLSAAGAIVDVFAPHPAPTISAVGSNPPRGTVRLHHRRWRADDLRGATLAIGAIDEEGEAAAFAEAARARRVLVNVVDRPALCDFAFGSIVNRSPLVIGISTDGAAPALAQALRARIEALVPKGLKRWAAAAKAWRPAIQAASPKSEVRHRIWEDFAAAAFAKPDEKPTAAVLANLLRLAENVDRNCRGGQLTLVKAGGGDVGSLTVNGIRVLQSADVIVCDAPLPHDFLEFGRREARTIDVTGLATNEVEALLNALVAEGKRVVRLAV